MSGTIPHTNLEDDIGQQLPSTERAVQIPAAVQHQVAAQPQAPKREKTRKPKLSKQSEIFGSPPATCRGDASRFDHNNDDRDPPSADAAGLVC